MAHTHSTPAPTPAQPSISRDFAPISTPDPVIRRLTVSYGARCVRGADGNPALAPLLRLQGAWLARAGFAIGVPVRVHVSSGRLVIEAAEPERVPRAEALTTIARLVADDGLTKRDFHQLTRRLKRRRG